MAPGNVESCYKTIDYYFMFGCARQGVGINKINFLIVQYCYLVYGVLGIGLKKKRVA